MAFSTTLLPDVRPVISMASSIGTPAATSAENVREKRASAIFCTVSPIFHGIFSLKRSQCSRPFSVDFHLRKPQIVPQTSAMQRYHLPVTKCETSTVTCVIAGSLPPKSLNTPSNTGTMNTTSAIITRPAKLAIIVGYIIAAFTWRRSESSFSS